MPEEIFKVIDVIAVFQILVFIVILARHKQISITSKVFLVLFLVSVGICLADRIQFFYRELLHQLNFPHFYNTGDTFLLIYIPTLYFYYKSITTAELKLKWWNLWHFIPAVLVFVNLLFNYYLQPADIKFSRLHEGRPFYTKEYQLVAFNIIQMAQTAYFMAMLYLVQNFQRHIKETYSNFDEFQFSLLYLIPSVGLGIKILEYSLIFLHTETRVHLDAILVAYAILIIYLGYRQPAILLKPFNLNQKSPAKLPDQVLEQQLMRLIENEKCYLEPTITLPELASKLNVGSRELSSLLNNQLKISFFNFINDLRIEEAKKLLVERSSNKTVLEILYTVGFNNKSAFNRVFKEKTGVTPTEFRRKKIN